MIVSSLQYCPRHSWRYVLGDGTDESCKHYVVDDYEFSMLVADFQRRRGPDLIIIDVREPWELVDSGRIPGTINIPRMFILFYDGTPL